jgi:hypothetical protein
MRRALALAALAGILASCIGASPPASPSPATAVGITATTLTEIEAALQVRIQALANRDLAGFQAAIDLTRPAFRRCQLEQFDIASRQRVSPVGPKVAKVESYGTDYVRAYLVEDDGLRRIYFRRDGDRWIVTEPRIDELGGERTKTIAGIKVTYWGIDEDVIELIGREAGATLEYAKGYARGPFRDAYSVRVFPTRESTSIVDCWGDAFANFREEHAPLIGFYRVWFDRSLTRVSDGTRDLFRHESLHYVQDQFIHGIGFRLDWWLIEGWPDHIAGTRTVGEIRAAVCATNLPTLKRLIDGVPTEPGTPPELNGQFYALANSLIDYVQATYGPNAYWDLVALYADNPDYRATYPKIFKVEPDAFYQDWLAFAKKKYC